MMKRYTLGVLAMAAFSLLGAQTQIDLRTQAKSIDFSNASSTKPAKTGTVLPAACSVGEVFLKIDADPGENLYACTAANEWSAQGSALPYYESGGSGKVLINDESGARWEILQGDVSGGPTSLTVTRLQGQPVAAATPSNGHVLSWTGTQWTPQAPALGSVFGRTGSVTAQPGDYSAAQITNAVDRTAATTYAAGARQTFVAGASASAVRIAPAALPASPQSGDVAVDSGDSNRAKMFDGTSWIGLGAVPNYFTSFAASTAVTVAGSTHKLNTANLLVECYDDSAPAKQVEPDRIEIDPATYDVTAFFAVPQTGRLVINAAGAGGASGAEASAVLDFPSIAAGSCAAEMTLAVPGAAPGDEVAAGWPAGFESGLIGMMRVTAADTVAVRVCNLSGSAVDPASRNFRARIVRNF